MAWYKIEGICGHIFEKQLYGKCSSRDSYVEWANNHLECPDCYKMRIEKERLELTEKAKKEASNDNFVELEGSEKQINWALSIRKSKIDSLRKIAGENSSDNEIIEWIKNKVNSLKNQKSSKWFIDNRSIYSIEFIEDKIEENKDKETGKNLVG